MHYPATFFAYAGLVCGMGKFKLELMCQEMFRHIGIGKEIWERIPDQDEESVSVVT